ncbi:MAG: helix-turn-helix domain-containing protein [Thermoleophilia bacterium]
MAAPRKPAKPKRPATPSRTKPDPEIAAFGERLRALRLEAGMTQEALAHAAGLHWTYIGQIERGRRNLTLKNVLRLARGLGVEPARLVQ